VDIGVLMFTTGSALPVTDLARASRIFVKIHGWHPNPVWSELKRLVAAQGFLIET